MRPLSVFDLSGCHIILSIDLTKVTRLKQLDRELLKFLQTEAVLKESTFWLSKQEIFYDNPSFGPVISIDLLGYNQQMGLHVKPLLFPLGQVAITPGAADLLNRLNLNAVGYITRHCIGDFGDLDSEDITANKAAVIQGSRVFSSYKLGKTAKIWVITEADRSSTTILLPDEY